MGLASLEPIFILATVLPASFLLGTLYLLAYIAGLSLVLLLISLLGQGLTRRLQGIADSHGATKRIVGIVFIVLGVLVIAGYDKVLETAILDAGYFDIVRVENALLESVGVE